LILVQGERQGSSFNLLMWIPQFSQQHLFKRLSFLHYMFWAPLSQIYRCIGLCLGLLFWSIGLPVCFCANSVLFLLLLICSIFWSQVLWCPQHWTFCSELLWLFEWHETLLKYTRP
jgi:hypothetical protein